ncbi:MAG: molybdopterin-dependent oxidoreductase [Pseudomonadota bacterium]
MTNQANAEADWKPTACNLCYANCGVLVQIGGEDGRRILRVKGDKAHPASKGYTCNKALQLDYYQNGRDRLTQPLRRTADGGFEPISWETAVAEIAAKMSAIRDAHGGDKIFRYGGGGQGNHLGGAYFGPVAAALGMKYQTNALAQEKTGLAWMMGRMFRANVHGDLDHAQTLVISGKNPWQSNGFQRARILLREISKDPSRTLIVLDPRLTETAELADIHLAVKPGRDAWALAAMIGHIVQEDLIPHDWHAAHSRGVEAVAARFAEIPVDAYAQFAGLDPADVKRAARAVAEAESAAHYEDLGVQMAPHSTLVSYLDLLLMTLCGHFGRKGTMATLSQLPGPFFSFRDIGDGDDDGYEPEAKRSPVTGARIVSGLVPCNAAPDEILTDHADRFRAIWIESGNPAHSMADSARWREALRALELVVVIDVAMTETAREAHYVLPAASQYEKWEATFFNFEAPANVHHLRAPLFAPLGDTLPEPEIHARMVEALGAVDPAALEPLKAAATQGLEAYGPAMFGFVAQNPALKAQLPYILYRTLGPSLTARHGAGAAATAAYWGLAQRFAAGAAASVKRAGFEGDGLALGDRLFEGILAGRSGMVFSIDDPDGAFAKLGHKDRKIRLDVGEMLDALGDLGELEDLVARDEAFPFILAAGERRAYTANTIIRDPNWMKSNDVASLAIHPKDAAAVGVGEGGQVRIVTKAGEAVATVVLDERMRPGAVSLPNGLGLLYPDARGEETTIGVAPNELTSLDLKDAYLGTPLHKHVPARLEAV